MDILYKQATSIKELQQILRLQQRNLPQNLSTEEIEKEGFVTVRHELKLLSKMNEICGHVLAKHGDFVAGYALCMHPSFANALPVLKPMFDQIEKILPQEQSYMVMGQVCIDKAYRSMGIFRGLYTCMQQVLNRDYESIITEVDASNSRSVNAHRAIGFHELCRYSSGKQDWLVIKLATNVA